jgi:hypothetical protein
MLLWAESPLMGELPRSPPLPYLTRLKEEDSDM